MKKISLLIFCLGITNIYAQLVVDAPILEGLTTNMMSMQLETKQSTYQTQLNTLQSAQNSASTLEQIQKLNKQIEEVNSKLRAFDNIKRIYDISERSLKSAKETNKLVNKYPLTINGVNMGVKVNSQVQQSLNNLQEIVKFSQQVMSNDLKMNDYERKKLSDEYEKKAVMENARLQEYHKKYSFLVGINGF